MAWHKNCVRKKKTPVRRWPKIEFVFVSTPLNHYSERELGRIQRHFTIPAIWEGAILETYFIMWCYLYLWNAVPRGKISQLYGSTTVVMAIYSLHWKWQSLTPCQKHPSEQIEQKFGPIDYVIDLNNLAKCGFGKIFGDWGTYTQHISVCAFFLFF